MSLLCGRAAWLAVLSLGSSLAVRAAEPEVGAAFVDGGEAPLLETEKIPGEGVWAADIRRVGERQFAFAAWFDDQLLGDGKAYLRRIGEFDDIGRTELRRRAVRTLKAISDASYRAAEADLDKLVADGTVSRLQRHWIVNGFSGVTDAAGWEKVQAVAGVRAVFLTGAPARADLVGKGATPHREVAQEKFVPGRYAAPWYVEKLGADRVWKELGVTGAGVLNVINDFNFLFSENTLASIYENAAEPINGKDDDGNGLIDDRHGYDFLRGSGSLTPAPLVGGRVSPPTLHGHQCAAIICGVGRAAGASPEAGGSNQLGIAPESKWAGVIAGQGIESAIEWAIEHEADTYSMSFSRPGLGEARSHWRKMMEHGALCGVHFVSGAGNFAKVGSRNFAPVPVQMRTPEDIPQVVFAAAGVKRDLSRAPFSSQGPVTWNLHHYKDGQVEKPEVCAFNFELPLLLPDGRVMPGLANGNSFAGPMFCGSIALILSANPELKPWEVRKIIIDTASDVGAEGFDFQTGHGLIDIFAAVRRALEMREETGG